jgi:multiple antibiotic resistance protein
MEEKLIRDALMLWATIDPVGTLAIFASVTTTLTPALRRKTALKATLYSAAILLGSIVIGQILLSALGIDLLSLQVAGGAILFLFALQMIFGSGMQEEGSNTNPDHDLAVFPLAVPSIASPGAIMAVIVLTDNNLHGIADQALTAGVLLGVLLVTYLLMLASTQILRVIGTNGAAILVRVMGLILAALSVQLVFEALEIGNWISTVQ